MPWTQRRSEMPRDHTRAPRPIVIGTRVTLNDYGRRVFHRMPDRGGEIVGECWTFTGWKVLWDGNRSPQQLHKTYVQREDER